MSSAAFPNWLADGRFVLVAIIAGVTWMGLVGVALGTYIITDGPAFAAAPAHRATTSYAVYEIQWPVPTSFGSLAVMAASANGGTGRTAAPPDNGDEPIVPPDKFQLQLSLMLSNDQNEAVDAPRPENFRVVSTHGVEADRLPELWRAPAELGAHTTSPANLAFRAADDGSALWLEYRDRAGDSPVRVALGWARQIPEGALEAASVSVQADTANMPTAFQTSR